MNAYNYMHFFHKNFEVIKVSNATTRKAGVADTPESGSLDPGSCIVSTPDPPSEHG